MTIPRREIQYQVDVDGSLGGVTAFAGLPALLETARALGVSSDLAELGLFRSVPGAREVGCSEALLALLASGGECLSDIEMLRCDPGLGTLLGNDAFPDARRLGEFLARFHEPAVGTGGCAGQAVVAQESPPLRALGRVNLNLVNRIQRLSPSRRATLDWDTQCIEADKRDAHWCYKGFPGYQPGAIYWAEQGLVLADQFLAGNVPSGFRIADTVRAAIRALPSDVEDIEFRADAAAYDWELMDYLRDRGIGFAITADNGEELRGAIQALPESAWSKLHRRTEVGKVWQGEHWAEVAFASLGDRSLKREPLRFIVIRYPIRRRSGDESPGQADLGFPLDAEEFRRRYRVVATNRTESGDEILLWSAGRCGSIERVFRVMNNEQAAASPPCGKFGANAAWYRYNVLLFNLVQAMRLLVLPAGLATRSLKVLRLRILAVAGRVVRGASRIWKLKIQATSPALAWLAEIRSRIQDLGRRIRAMASPAPS